jgi:hypothetical protein
VHVGVALATAGHAAQLAPQEFTLVFDAQTPLQSWVPLGQAPMHDAAWSMHAFAHSFWPARQVAPHFVPSHVARPPSGAGQAEQDVPHEAGDVSSAHPPLQAWVPARHENVHR